jgi:hypothetical protein
MWTNDQIQILINKRKGENKNYHDLNDNLKCNFWKSLASEINIKFGTTYSGKQCKEKFQSLVRAFKVYKTLFNSTIILLFYCIK